MADYRNLRDIGASLMGEHPADRPINGLMTDLQELLDSLPIKGWTTYDIVLTVIGMAADLDATADYQRGYADGRRSVIDSVGSLIGLAWQEVNR